MSDNETKLDRDMETYEDSISETDVRSVRDLFPNDAKFNPVTPYRVVSMFERLSVDDMGLTVKIIIDKYVNNVSNKLVELKNVRVNNAVASSLTDDRYIINLLKEGNCNG